MQDLQGQAAQRVGTVVGQRFRIERLLGVGGMGAVYAAVDGSGQHVAVKLLHPEMNRVPEIRKRFVREAAIGNVLSSAGVRGIVPVYETGIDPDGSAFAVMEQLDGEELYDLLTRERRLPVPMVLDLAQQILEVLVAAHERGIVHRDLKPENLFAGRDGRYRVLDFGLARVLDAVPESVVLPEKTMTKSGVILGTAAYMAPEQAIAVASEIDERADLYAVGATMYRALSGGIVHSDMPLSQQVIAAATRPARPLIRVAPQVPPAVCSVVDRALAFKKEHRYPSAGIMLGDIRALAQGLMPPYATAIAEGRIRPGEPLGPGPTAPDGMGRPARTEPDHSSARPGPTVPDTGDAKIWWIVAGAGGLLMFAAGVVVALVALDLI